MVAVLAALLFALSLCADCFAVSACSSVSVKDFSWKRIALVAAIFALVQSGLLVIGWTFGDILFGFVGKLAPVVGFLLLLYVGGSMIVSSITDREESRNLDGFRNILIGAVATSIDALAAGISLSMDSDSFPDMILKAVAVLVVTFVSVVLGIKGGTLAGRRYGRPALLVGGIVLVVIGLNILFKFI